jgi:histidine triad (HIT) family protein
VSDCIFCKIASKQIPSDLVHEGEHVVAFRDINPQAPTHIQIIPRKHVAHISEYTPGEDTAWLEALLETANMLAEREGLERGYRLVINNGPLAGQSVFHVHLHLLGGRQLTWPPG